MSKIAGFFRFVWDFVVGDDWRIAVGVAVALGVSAVVANAGIAAWWVVPVVVGLVLTLSVWTAARR